MVLSDKWMRGMVETTESFHLGISFAIHSLLSSITTANLSDYFVPFRIYRVLV
jgi:hypothetical protein